MADDFKVTVWFGIWPLRETQEYLFANKSDAVDFLLELKRRIDAENMASGIDVNFKYKIHNPKNQKVFGPYR